MTKRSPNLAPAHPGAILREDVLPALGKTKVEVARALGVSRQALYDVVSERRSVTPEMAVRLGKLCGNGPDVWLRMQVAHDLWHARRNVSVDAIPTLPAAE